MSTHAPHTSPKYNVVVLGAGVIGLQTAVSLLQAGYAVTIIAECFPGDKSIKYTSPWAGAQWRTHAPKEDKEQQQWDVESYEHWLRLLKDEGEADSAIGLGLYDSYFYWWYPDPEIEDGDASKAWFAPHLQNFSAISKEDLPQGAWAGAKFTSVMVNPPRYLAYLLEQATQLGANVVREVLPASAGLHGAIEFAKTLIPDHLSEVDVWVNATGLGAAELVPDPAMFPVRGQTVIVKGEAKRITTVEDKNPKSPTVTYILPRPGSKTSVLGGTKQAGNWEAKPDDATTAAILERSKRWAPELLTGRDDTFEILDVCVGLRPGRKGGARVEIERLEQGPLICHAYGHAGAGYQNSVGSARKVVRLIDGVTEGGSAAP